MGGYTYRFENVPAYVPPGHGMVYLTAVALARSALFVRHPGKIALLVIAVWGTWSLWGVSGYPNRGDWVGALLFGILVWLLIGRSPMVYLAAFFITTWLELIGTAVGAWEWATIDPLGMAAGKSPERRRCLVLSRRCCGYRRSRTNLTRHEMARPLLQVRMGLEEDRRIVSLSEPHPRSSPRNHY